MRSRHYIFFECVCGYAVIVYGGDIQSPAAVRATRWHAKTCPFQVGVR